MEQLQWYLLQADAENAGKILRRILGSLQEGQVSFNFARMVCFDVVNMTVRTLNTGRDSRSAPAVRPEMLEQLISFDTVPELLGMLETFVDETCASMQAQPDARENRAQDMQDPRVRGERSSGPRRGPGFRGHLCCQRHTGSCV